MQPDLALPFLERKLQELGVKTYVIEYEQVTIAGDSTLAVEGHNNLLVLLETPTAVSVKSQLGEFGTGSKNTHLHNGLITIENKDSIATMVSFLKAIIQD